MNIEELKSFSIDELRQLSKRSDLSRDVLFFLAENPDLIVRRLLARNHSVPTEIVNKLAMDCVQNVSFMALKNPNCTITRTFIDTYISPCVKCGRDDITKICGDNQCGRNKES